MPVFRYTALDLADGESAGTLIAETPAEGRRSLRERGLRIVSFGAARLARSRLGLADRSRRRRQEQVAEHTRYLSLLLGADVPLAEAIDVLTLEGGRGLRTVWKDVRDRVTGGTSLAEALGAHHEWFDPLTVSAVRMGELSGSLDKCFAELADHLRAQQTLRGRLTGALAYPLILASVSVMVVVFLTTYVIPQLVTVLAASGRPLPASTALLMRMSNLLVLHWPFVLLVAAIVVGSSIIVLRDDRGRLAWHRAQLSVPVVRTLIQRSLIARFAQRMALLLGAGVPFVEAARSVADLTSNRVLAGELDLMARAVESGSDIAPAIRGSRVFPPVVVHLIAVGQESGELPAMLAELKTRYETEVTLALEKFTAAVEPLLIVTLAAVVGFIVLACLLPILEATRAIA